MLPLPTKPWEGFVHGMDWPLKPLELRYGQWQDSGPSYYRRTCIWKCQVQKPAWQSSWKLAHSASGQEELSYQLLWKECQTVGQLLKNQPWITHFLEDSFPQNTCTAGSSSKDIPGLSELEDWQWFTNIPCCNSTWRSVYLGVVVHNWPS